jgi:hypothetical protein
VDRERSAAEERGATDSPKENVAAGAAVGLIDEVGEATERFAAGLAVGVTAAATGGTGFDAGSLRAREYKQQTTTAPNNTRAPPPSNPNNRRVETTDELEPVTPTPVTFKCECNQQASKGLQQKQGDKGPSFEVPVLPAVELESGATPSDVEAASAVAVCGGSPGSTPAPSPPVEAAAAPDEVPALLRL